MTAAELAKIFRTRYHTAQKGYRVTSIHLFGIEFAEALRGHDIKDICVEADVSVSYVTEIYKGMRLSEFVDIRK